eukprot:282486-Pleurochrysis_carterae.AAC.1
MHNIQHQQSTTNILSNSRHLDLDLRLGGRPEDLPAEVARVHGDEDVTDGRNLERVQRHRRPVQLVPDLVRERGLGNQRRAHRDRA